MGDGCLKVVKSGRSNRPNEGASDRDAEGAAFDRLFQSRATQISAADLKPARAVTGQKEADPLGDPLSTPGAKPNPLGSMTANLSALVGRGAAALIQQSQDLRSHLCGCNYADPDGFGMGDQGLREASNRLRQLFGELMGNLDAQQPGSRMGQMQGMLQVMKTISTLLQDLQQSSFQGSRAQAKPNTRDIQHTMNQLNQLVTLMRQIEQGMTKLQPPADPAP